MQRLLLLIRTATIKDAGLCQQSFPKPILTFFDWCTLTFGLSV